MRERMTLSSATARLLLLSLVLSVVAALLAAGGSARTVLPIGLPRIEVAVLLAVAFGLGEQLLLNMEFRRQAHTFTLAGVPLAAGVLLAPVGDVVVARVVGAGLALLLQRVRWDKIVYNCAAYAFEAGVDTVLAHVLLGSGHDFGMSQAAALLVLLAAVDQLMSGLVLVVIKMHGGGITRRDVVEVVVQSAVLSVVATSATIGVWLLARQGPLGVVVVLVFVAMSSLLYRGYLTTTQRHQRLELIHEFVSGSVGADSLEAVAQQMLGRIRVLLRAETAELLVFPDRSDVPAAHPDEHGIPVDGAERATRITVTEAPGWSLERSVLRPDWVTTRSLDARQPMLAARNTKDAAARQWLASRDYRDAILVPLPSTSSFVGTLTVSNRLGEFASFEADDVTLLETLIGHLAVAGETAHLVERLGYEASHDALTGLANRSFLSQRIASLDERSPDAYCVLLIDLDRFKEINDSLGHAAGDEVLKELGSRLSAILPDGSTVARLGGDEFAALVPTWPDDVPEAGTYGHRLAVALAEPIRIDESLITPDVSIGIALIETGTPPADLLRRADTAMYRAKADDCTVAVYDESMDEGRLANLALLAELRSALREHPEQITVYYQPKIDLRTREVSGAEALVRWDHPRLGIVTPDRFIPLAETTGLIDQFTPLVLGAALAECRRWLDAGHDVSVAVNLSARNIGDETLPGRVADALARAGLSARHLILEITESSIIADPTQTMHVLHRLAERGVTVSLDDFGTGYSSLSYLQKLPVQEVKIDRSFVAGLASESRSSRALISSIAGLGDHLGLRVVAEGAECAEVVEELAELGCDVVQGYHISRPLPADDFAEWLDAHDVPGIAGELDRPGGAAEWAVA